MTIDSEIGTFLEDLASGKPTPGGGGAAALCGSMAAALTSMVCNLTIGKKKYADVSQRMEEILAEADALRRDFNELIDKDAEAFSELLSAFKMPKETDDEKAVRSQTIQEATVKAASVPLEVIRKCLKVLPLANYAAEKGNANAVSDAGVSALLVGAAAQSAALNVNINLMGIKDREWAGQVFKEMTKTLTDIRMGTETVLKTVSEKIAG